MPNLDNQTVLLAIVAVTALAMLLQTIFLLAILVSVRKTARSLKEEAEDLRSSVMPLVYNTRDLFARLAPKVEAAVTDVAGMARGLREQTAELESAINEVVERVRRQASRVDAMATGVLDSVDRAGSFVVDAVSGPVRQLNALLAAAKAVVESLRASERGPRPSRSAGDEEPFV